MHAARPESPPARVPSQLALWPLALALLATVACSSTGGDSRRVATTGEPTEQPSATQSRALDTSGDPLVKKVVRDAGGETGVIEAHLVDLVVGKAGSNQSIFEVLVDTRGRPFLLVKSLRPWAASGVAPEPRLGPESDPAKLERERAIEAAFAAAEARRRDSGSPSFAGSTPMVFGYLVRVTKATRVIKVLATPSGNVASLNPKTRPLPQQNRR